MTTDDKNKIQTDLERLIAEEKADKLRETQALKKTKGNWARNQKIAGGAVAAAVVLLIGGITIYDPFTASLRWGDGPDQVKTNSNQTSVKQNPYSWAQESGKLFPEKTEPWEESFYKDMKEESFYQDSLEAYWEYDFLEAFNMLPSEELGFTSDDSLSMIDNAPNPDYSYWTKEVLQKETMSIFTRLLNPIFGGWESFQFNEFVDDENTMNRFSDIFTEEWISNHQPSDLPIYANWTGDSYGNEGDLMKIGEGHRWLGKISNTETAINFDPDISQYNISIKADIVFTAWTSSQEKVERTGVLTLDLVSNYDAKNSSSNKVLISNASLVVN